MSTHHRQSRGLGVRQSSVARPALISKRSTSVPLDPVSESGGKGRLGAGVVYPGAGVGYPYPPAPGPHMSQPGVKPEEAAATGPGGHYPYPYGAWGAPLPPHYPHYPPPYPAHRPPQAQPSTTESNSTSNLASLKADLRKYPVVLITESFGEAAGRCRSIQKIVSNLGVDEGSEMRMIALDTRPTDGPAIGRYIAETTGYSTVPVMFVAGQCVGDYQSILNLTRSDKLRESLMDAGIKSVVNAIPTATLENNIYGYPKALGSGQVGHRRDSVTATLNVLIACCGSSASDKIPTLVESCVAQGWSVKLLCTTAGEHFYKSFGMARVLNAIGAENVYRDEDEWSFEYDAFDMPVRACHLAIRKWADVMVVAPITCNSMAKAAAGIGDNLLSSVFVAWEYHKKRIIFCPACNVDMWNNAPTQRNVAFLKTMGVEFLGPRVDRLTNGQVAIGCMEKVENIIERLKLEENELMTGDEWYFRRAKQAALQDNDELWQLVVRAVEEKLLDVNAVAEESGNTLLHLAAGGESFVDGAGEAIWGTPDLEPMEKLIAAGADVNIRNEFDFAPIHVAVAANEPKAVQLLVDSGADCQGVLVDFPEAAPEIKEIFANKPESSKLATTYYFTYGSLKRGFPNHENQAKHLQNYVGKASTVESYPLVVPFKKSCTNPHCPYLHQQASLCNHPGTGKRVNGEVFEVAMGDIVAFDGLEGFNGMGINGNVYSRRIIDVEIEGKGIQKAYIYFSTSNDPMLQVAAGEAEFVDTYLLEMAKGELKPGFEKLAEERNKRRTSIMKQASTRLMASRSSHTRSSKPGMQRFKGLSTLNVLGEETDDDSVLTGERDLSVVQSRSMSPGPGTRSRSPSPVPTGHRRLTMTPVGQYDKCLAENIGLVQQAINTCNLASITLALKGLGVECSIDDIFANLHLPVSWVVEQGLTLAQVFNVLVKLCGSTNSAELLAPGIKVECYHFDKSVADYNSFLDYLRESLADEDDVLIVNFNTKIAKDMENGGGHFSLISGYDDATKTVSIADVHPKKYGAHWACSAQKLFDAMVDKDGSSKRSRGLIQVALSKAKPISSLDACCSSVNFRNRVFGPAEQEWLSRWGDLPILCHESHLNFGGLSSLALAVSGFLSAEDYENLALQNHVGADFIAWTLRLSITELLSSVLTPRSLTNYARRTCEALSLGMRVTCEEADLTSPSTLSKFLLNRVGSRQFCVALVLLDLNIAHGHEVMSTNKDSEAAALHHGTQHWCVVVSVPDKETAIIADPCAKAYGRLWKCKMENLRNGLVAAEESPGTMVFLRAYPNVGASFDI